MELKDWVGKRVLYNEPNIGEDTGIIVGLSKSALYDNWLTFRADHPHENKVDRLHRCDGEFTEYVGRWVLPEYLTLLQEAEPFDLTGFI